MLAMLYLSAFKIFCNNCKNLKMHTKKYQTTTRGDPKCFLGIDDFEIQDVLFLEAINL